MTYFDPNDPEHKSTYIFFAIVFTLVITAIVIFGS